MNEKKDSHLLKFGPVAGVLGLFIIIGMSIPLIDPIENTTQSGISCQDVAQREINKHGTFAGYLKSEKIPKQINVDGKTYEVNVRLARLDCELVYGNFNDIPSDIQELVGTEWLYVGYDENGEPKRNVYVLDPPTIPDYHLD